MATLAKAATEKGVHTALCTSDKDCRQLITDHVSLYNLRKREWMDAGKLREDWGVTPEQAIEYQMLVGDSVDNVAGVPGVGAKTATKLLQENGTIENILANLDELLKKKSLSKKIKENFEAARAAGTLDRDRQLVTLDTAVPIEIDWEKFRLRQWDGPKLLGIFESLGFRGYAGKVRATMKTTGKAKNFALLEELGFEPLPASDSDDAPASGGQKPPNTTPETVDPFDFPFGFAAPEDDFRKSYVCVRTPESFDAFMAALRQQKRFAFDLETTSLDALNSETVGISFSWDAGNAYYLPIMGPAGEQVLVTRKPLSTALKPIFEDAAVAKVNQNIKFDWLALNAQGIIVQGIAGDSMVAHYLLHAGERSHGPRRHDADLFAARKHLDHRVDRQGQVAEAHGPSRGREGFRLCLRGRRRRLATSQICSSKNSTTRSCGSSTTKSKSRSSTCWPTSNRPASASMSSS